MNPTPAPTVIPRALIVRPEEGRQLHAFGDSPLVKLDGTHTNNSLTVVLNSTPPGGGPPPHLHRAEDEIFMVVEGSYRFMYADGTWTEPLGPGSLAYLPRGTRHTFQNAGDTVGHAWIIATPSGFETFFARCSELFGAGGPPDVARVITISTEHGIEYVPPLGAGAPPTSETPPVL